MKIAHVVCTFPPYHGGIGNVAYKYAENLNKAGADVTVFTPNYNQQTIPRLGFKCVALKPWLKYGNGAWLPQLFWRLKDFDIVHLHYPFFGGAEMVWLRKILLDQKMKLFIHYHMDIDKLALTACFLSWPDKLIRNSLFNLAEAITCASFDYIQESAINDVFKKYNNKFYELSFGVDCERFQPGVDWLVKKNRILFVGSLDKAHNFKGLEILLSAMTKIKESKLNLTVVGGGNLLPFYRKMAEDKGVASRIEFTNFVSDELLPIYYQKADLLVLPSTSSHEAFGLVLLEAMSSGIPVIASNLPGVRTVFRNGVEGFLAEVNSPNDLAEKISIILAEKNSWQKMCQAARSLAVEKYSWEKIAKKMNELYKIN